MSAHGRSSPRARRGAAMLSVLLVLLALLVLCAPFLMTATNASRASGQAFDRAQARAALDSAGRFARARLGASHAAVDPTPWHDTPEELAAVVDLDPAVLDHRDPRGVQWDFEAESLAARIDLCSAPPQVFANMLGAATRLSQLAKKDDKELAVSSTHGFPEAGFLWVDRELIGYTKRGPQSFAGLVRGLGVERDAEGNALPCGPQPQSDLPPGTPVYDQRAWALALWRAVSPDGDLRVFDAPEQLHGASDLALGGLDGEAVAAFERTGSVYAGVRGGSRWQRAARLVAPLVAGRDCVVRVDNWRWFNPGTTVQIRGELGSELGLVLSVSDSGIRLMQPVSLDHAAFRSEVRPLARRPVDANAAAPEVLEVLFTNLQLRGVNERITRDEARALAALVVESRPFTGLEDFLRRVVLPAAGLEALPGEAPVRPEALRDGGTLIDPRDAQALYANALNANDARLLFSTMPLSFVSRDVYRLELRASVSARSAAERATRVREEVAVVAPQMELLQAWMRQEDFDEALRPGREAPYWATGPNATSHHDSGATPPSRLWPHLGVHAGRPYLAGVTELPPGSDPSSPPQAERVFASREEGGWAQLLASEAPELAHWRGRIAHFRHETRELEGRYLPEQGYARLTADPEVGWSVEDTRLMLPVSFSMWFQPGALAEGLLLDVAASASFADADRLTLGIEAGELLLRVFDGAGDRSDTQGFQEAGEARMAIQPGEGPGLEAGTWSHVSIDVRGTRPDQITMLVDGRDSGVRVAGRTRLAVPLTSTGTVVQLEDDLGFPPSGVVRIGEELLEYVRLGPRVLNVGRTATGPLAGFGGRHARPTFSLSPSWEEPGLPVDLAGGAPVNTSHPASTPVMLYGYSLPLLSGVPQGGAQLPSDLGMWRVAVVDEVITGSSPSPHKGTPIILQGNPPFTTNLQIGRGIEAAGPDVTTALVLRSADDVQGGSLDMRAFNSGGGYALLFQKLYNGSERTVNGSLLLDMEVIQYSGYSGSTLFIASRGGPTTGAGGPPWPPPSSTPRAFVVEWEPGIPPLAARNGMIEWKTFVVPISLPAPGGATAFLAPNNGSEFAQITEPDEAERTEWVRYDEVRGDQLVRNDYIALRELQRAVTIDVGDIPPPPPPGPPDPPPPPAMMAPPPPPPEPIAAAQSVPVSTWLPYIGVAGDVDLPLTRAARTAFQFRGVLGTYSHEHAGGTQVLPVWRVRESGGADGGLPGRLDMASLFDAAADGFAYPVRVHRAYRPLHHERASWIYGGSQLVAATGPMLQPPGYNTTEVGFETNAIHVALQQPVPVLFAPGSNSPPGTFDPRATARLTCHPSGELPRIVERLLVGGSLRGDPAPAVIADEVVTTSPQIGAGASAGPMTRGGSFRLTTDLAAGGTLVRIAPQALRVPTGMWSDASMSLATPPHRGLLRIGGEILAYENVDVQGGSLRVAPNARALLGTVEEHHEAGETVTILEDWVAGLLAADIGPDDSTLPLLDATGFPPEGTVLVNGELIHYTRIAGNALEMPRASSVAGRMDGRGPGVFRGRYGTGAGAHIFGSAVILYPFRYWDRWADRFDGPELAYFGFELHQPGAWWRTLFFDVEEPSGGATVHVLQRLDPGPGREAHWDADPERDEWVERLERGMPGGAGNTIGRQSDLAQWRAFVRYPSGAYDAIGGRSHAWKQTPRLRLLGAEYLAPELVLRRVDR